MQVPSECIAQLWPHVEPILARAHATGIGDGSLEDTRADLFTDLAQLWIVWTDEDGILAAAVTVLKRTSKGLVCQIMAAAGRDLRRWARFITDLEDFARAEGCAALRVQGRPGWRRVLPDYHEPFITLERTIQCPANQQGNKSKRQRRIGRSRKRSR